MEGTNNEEYSQNCVIKKVVILGDIYVGKTSIALRFVKNTFTDLQESTVGAVFLTHEIQVGSKKIKFDIWDTAGQERYKSLAPMYYKGSKAALVVYDITSYDTYKKAKEWIQELHENASLDIIIGVVGNKIDLEQSRQEVEEYCEKNDLLFYEVSAKSGANITEVFKQIAAKIPDDQSLGPQGMPLRKNSTNQGEKLGWFSYC